ncbi:hypothetical protein ACFQY0_20810, partial [Haloferula chungangensis]
IPGDGPRLPTVPLRFIASRITAHPQTTARRRAGKEGASGDSPDEASITGSRRRRGAAASERNLFDDRPLFRSTHRPSRRPRAPMGFSHGKIPRINTTIHAPTPFPITAARSLVAIYQKRRNWLKDCKIYHLTPYSPP